MSRFRVAGYVAGVAGLTCAMLAVSTVADAQTAITLTVDATQAPMKILHATSSMPVKPGPMALFYAKWIPGEHQASGPIANLVGLHVFAGATELDWRRDLIEMNAFQIVVPPGATSIRATYDYVVPTSGGSYGAAVSADATCAVINWYEVVLYPRGENPDTITVTTTLKTPTGWKHGGSLDIATASVDTIQYAPTSLALLNDHPIMIGEHLRSITLWPASSDVGEHVLDVVADSEWALQFPPERIDAYKRLVREERAVFGDVGHYRKYHWLLTLSDNLGSFGVEHHECADDRVAENTFVDDDAAKRASLLLPHEFFHSWNGKARRPNGLLNPGAGGGSEGGYEQPMKTDLLWVYEGLTNYYGELLAARAGLISAAEWMDELAADAMYVGHTGRAWRPLQDTADAAPFLYSPGSGWEGWRRGVDFYDEGSLIWLDADVTIRRLTAGKKTLDDFCTLFHGEKKNGAIYVEGYDARDVYAALNTVAPYDWKTFFETRLNAKGMALPLGGVEGGGFTLVYTAAANMFTDPWALDGGLNAAASLGIHVTADGTVDDAQPNMPAFAAGLANSMRIVAINGRKFSIDELRRVIAASTTATGPMEFIVENSGYFSVLRVTYHGGTRYPHLLPTAGHADVLTAIAAPRKAAGGGF